MKINSAKLRQVVNAMLAEASKKKKKEDQETKATPAGYSKSPNLDFSAPLGNLSRYKQQGQANFGPYTGAGPDMKGVESFGPWKALSDYLDSIEESKGTPWEQARDSFLKRSSK